MVSVIMMTTVVLSSACSSEEEATPCQALWSDMCARAAACNPNGPEVVVQRSTPSGGAGVALTYSDEADCRGGASFCKEDGPIQACKDALAGSECANGANGSPSALLLPAACVGID